MSSSKSFNELISDIENISGLETDVQRRKVFEDAHSLIQFEGKTTAEREQMSHRLITAMTKFWQFRKDTFMGFQAAQNLVGCKERLGDLMDMQLNNIGDPFYDNSGFRLNCKVAERAILRYYGLLWAGPATGGLEIQPGSDHAPTPEESNCDEQQRINDTSGYVTCMGSTEGNTYMCRQARDYLKGKFLLPIYKDGSESSREGGGRQHRNVGSQMVMAKRRTKEDVPSITILPDFKAARDPHMMKETLSTIAEKILAKKAGGADHITSPDNQALALHIKNIEKSTIATTATRVVTPNASDPEATIVAHTGPLVPLTSHEDIKPMLPSGFSVKDKGFREPIILYSNASHYSIGKIKDMLEIHTPDTFIDACVELEEARSRTASPAVDHHHACCDKSHYFAVDRKPTLWDCFENSDEIKAAFPRNVWPTMVPTLEDGTFNLDALRLLVRFFFSLGNPVLVVCNYGTTFTGAHDDPVSISKVIRHQPGCREETQVEEVVDGQRVFHLTRRNYFIACDGALGAAYGSYFEEAKKHETNALFHAYYNDVANNGSCPFVKILKSLEPFNVAIPMEDIVLPTYNMRREKGVMAVSMSTHKFLGAPTPGGLILTARKYMLDFTGSGVSYIGSPDTSISGSRSGLNVMVLYDYITRNSHAKQITKYYALSSLARYAAYTIADRLGTSALSVARDKTATNSTTHEAQLAFSEKLRKQDEDAFKKLQATHEQTTFNAQCLPTVFNFPGSLSVIFPRPSPQTVDKYSLSCDTMKLYKARGYRFSKAFLDSAEGRALVSDKEDSPYYIMQCAHVFMMNHVDKRLVDALAEDLANDATISALYRNDAWV